MAADNYGGKRSGAGRPKGTRNRASAAARREVIAGLKQAGLNPKDFWEHVSVQAINGEGSAVTVLANRLCPALKPVDEKILMPALKSGTGTERALAVVDAVDDGQLTPLAGVALLDALAKVLSIEEQAELKQRIEYLEERLNKK